MSEELGNLEIDYKKLKWKPFYNGCMSGGAGMIERVAREAGIMPEQARAVIRSIVPTAVMIDAAFNYRIKTLINQEPDFSVETITMFTAMIDAALEEGK